MAKPGAKAKVSKEEWARAALDTITRLGVAKLAVEPLAKRLGVTKGSFYWHFSGRDDLLQAAVSLWERRETEAVIERVSAEPTPHARLSRLFREVGGDAESSARYLNLAAAAANPIVGPVLRRVSERRLGFLEGCFLELGFDGEKARHRALLAYSIYLGMLQMRRDLPNALPARQGFEAMLGDALDLFLPPA